MDNPSLSRRQFFKYATVGGLGSAALTYSPRSEAFVITAYAIYTGEQVGAYTKPIVDQLVEYAYEMFENYVNNITNVDIQNIGKSYQNITDAINEVTNNGIKRLTEPMPNICTRYSENSEHYERTEYTRSLAEEFSKQSNLNYKQLLSTNTLIDMFSGLAYAWNSFGDGNITDTATKANLMQLYYQMAFIDEDDKDNSNRPADWYTRVPPILRRKLVRAVLNEHCTKQLTDYFRDTVTRLDTTYHSSQWREQLNGIADPLPLFKELILEKAFENQIKYEISLSKQRLLLTDSLQAIESLKLGANS